MATYEDEMTEALRILERIVKGDGRTGREAHDHNSVETKLSAQRISISRQLVIRHRLQRWATRVAVAAMIVIDQPENISERVEPRVQATVVASQTAMHYQTGPAATDVQIEDLRAIDWCDRHGRPSPCFHLHEEL